MGRTMTSDDPAVSRGFLDYYESHTIIPVSQGHVPREVLTRQRVQLYLQLGVHPLCFRGSDVLEVGPGTGDNAEIVDSLGPSSLTLLDANPASVRALNRKIKGGLFREAATKVIATDFHDHADSGTDFDIVLAEGCIPCQVDPHYSLRSIARYVRPPSGILVITCAEPLGLLAEICRRLLKPAFMSASSGSFDSAVDLAAGYFGPDLRSLPGVTRTAHDWVVDQIFHPWPDRWHLSIDEALESLPDFDFLGSSPSFVVDWRWYKQFGGDSANRSSSAISQWRRGRLSLIDFRVTPDQLPPTDESLPEEVRLLVIEFDRLVQESWRRDSYDDSEAIQSVISEVLSVFIREPYLLGAYSALAEFQRELPRIMGGDLSGEIPLFRAWWGRGQQYLSMIRGKSAADRD